jgi:DNA modification methylase
VVNLGMQRKNGEVFEYWNDYIAEARSVGYKFLSWNIWRQDGAGSIGKQTAFFPIEHEWLFVFGKDFKNIKRTEKRKTSKNEEISTHREADGSVVSHNVGRQEAFKELGTVLELPSEKTAIRKEHPATYPVMLPQKFIEVMTNNGDSIIDPFLGSGSTLVAAEKTGRICYGMELDPKYVDVILKRWEDFTGKIAIKV